MYKKFLKVLGIHPTNDEHKGKSGGRGELTVEDELIENLEATGEDTRLSDYYNYKNSGEDPLFRTFVDKYGQPELVYYPCSGLHITPSFTFDHVVYVDLDAKSMQLLEQEGYHALHADVTKLDAIERQKADLMIIINPQVNDLDTLTRPLKVGGYVLCNNYHFTADRLWKNPNFAFVESLDGKGNGAFIPMKMEDLEGKNPFAPTSMDYCLFKKIK